MTIFLDNIINIYLIPHSKHLQHQRP